MPDIIRLAHSVCPFVTGYEGNVSCRADDQSFLIKGSGKRLSSLTPGDLVRCYFPGGHDGTLRPSMEEGMHRVLLSLPGVRFVAHTHPTNALKVLCSTGEARDFATKRLFPDQVVFNGPRSVLIDYKHPGAELAESVARLADDISTLGLPAIILLSNHGIVAIGETVDQCIVATEICEKSAEIFMGCSGTRSYLTDDQVEKLTIDEMEKHRKK